MKCRDHCWFCDPRSFASQRDFCILVHSTMDKVVLVVSFATIIWGHHTPFPSNDSASINHNPFLLLLSLTKIRTAVLFRFQKQLMWEEAMPDDPKCTCAGGYVQSQYVVLFTKTLYSDMQFLSPPRCKWVLTGVAQQYTRTLSSISAITKLTCMLGT